MSPKTSSSSVQAAASNQETEGRTTRAMKAKAQQNSSSQQTKSTNAASEDTKAGKSAKVAKETNPSSHLNTQNFSNGKIVANSNGKPESKQETIDQELEKYLKAQKLKPFHWGTQVEPLSNETMSKDFAEIGYSPDTIKALLKQKEPVKVDGLTQRPSAGFGKHVAGTGVSPTKPKKKPSTRGMPKYEALVLFAGQGTFPTSPSSIFWQELLTDIATDWVLFDPLKGYPEAMGVPPSTATRWERFAPENARILSQNAKTKTIKSQKTPAALRGITVDYTVSGPRIEGWVPIGTTKKTAAPPPAPAPPKKRKADEISAAPEPPAAAEVGGEGKEKKRRRPGRPKMSAARVENSSSE